MRWFFTMVFLGLGALCLQLLFTGAFRASDTVFTGGSWLAWLDSLATLSLVETALLAGAIASFATAASLLRGVSKRPGERPRGWARVLFVAFFLNVVLMALGLVAFGFAVSGSLAVEPSGNLFFLLLSQGVIGTALAVILLFLRKPVVAYALLAVIHLIEAGGVATITLLGAAA